MYTCECDYKYDTLDSCTQKTHTIHPIAEMYHNVHTPLIAALQDVFPSEVVYGCAVESVGVSVGAGLESLGEVELRTLVMISLKVERQKMGKSKKVVERVQNKEGR